MADELELDVREWDGSLGFVINLRHLPIVVETWFGGPSVELIDRYVAWLDRFTAYALANRLRVVSLHDASRSGLPNSAARQRLTEIAPNPDVLIDRVIVFDSKVVRSAVTALGWIVGEPYKTARDLDTGIEMCRGLLQRQGIEPPALFQLAPERAS